MPGRNAVARSLGANPSFLEKGTVSMILVVLGAFGIGVMALWLFGERWRVVHASTWRLLSKGGLRRFLTLGGVHSYVYLRWFNQYVRLGIRYIIPRLAGRAKQRVADGHHGKVVTLEQAEAIVTVGQEISLKDLEQVVPYSLARDLILQGPPEVAVYECACRHARDHPCKPTQVCMVVGQPFVDFVVDHNPSSSRRITQAEAVQLLQSEHERGHIHSAWFKDACLDRFYAICNCCKCCCAGIEAMLRYGVPMMAASGYLAVADQARCTGCGTCEEVCPFEAAHVDGTVTIDRERCMGCGVCVDLCPDEALSLVLEETKGVPLDVKLLASERAVAHDHGGRTSEGRA